MMRHAFKIAGFLAAAVISGHAFAQPSSTCPSGTTRQFNIASLVTGNTLCARRGTDRWQEFHQAGGPLIDYKLGPVHGVDPTKLVGNWTAVDEGAGTPVVGLGAILIHTYLGGSSYPWLLCRVGTTSTYTLVSRAAAGTITGATIETGQVPCPS